ncbi:hypothetical protein FHS59_001961 [Algoriphagus iocasae]|uniref:DUF3592 domain-containing protein n=1 Tax=Algoriphagus iocasae TaxID=1836499 RepID=A0A841MHK4_9BACT|nr:hypothetical protein [Algoriphagus iocasae]MBB6326333.1 hypothetical protein [Algoriphagus iocasae]
MERINPWTIGIIGLGAFLYLAWNNFQIPFGFWTSTAETEAIVTETAIGYGPKGMGFTQIITIQYQVGDSVYIKKKKLSQRVSKKEIGSEVLIEYAISDPNKYEIKGFIKPKKPGV